MQSLKRTAVNAALRGWFVFALNGKVPYKGTAGFKDATDDFEIVATMFDAHPRANVGFWPGPSGILGIDIDGPEGRATAERLGLFDEPTLTVITGRGDGGMHLLFAFEDDGIEIGNVQLGAGVEVRCHRGYLVMAGSIHPTTGAVYHYEDDSVPPAPLPSPVLDLIRKGSRSPRQVTANSGDICEGERNTALFSDACRRVRRGDSPSIIEAALIDINRARCSPPLEEAEVQRIAQSAESHRALEADAFLATLDFEHLTKRDGDKTAALKELLQAVQDWRTSSPTAMDEVLVRDEVLRRFKKAAVQSPAKMWDATDPLPIPSEEHAHIEQTTPPPSPEKVMEAEELLLKPNLLSECVQTTNLMGHLGEELNRQLVLLAGIAGITARSAKETIHLVLKGASSSGKNEMIRRVTSLFPQDLVHVLTGVSEQGLQYLGDVIRGVLVFQELEGQKNAEYQIRQAMSEGVLRRLSVRDLTSINLVTEVRCSIFTTTTSVTIHDENATRTLDLHTDSGAALTRRVIAAIGRAVADEPGSGVADDQIEVWRVALTLLEPCDVKIKYMGKLAQEFPTHTPRARRDFQKVAAILRASAILHQRTRSVDDEGRLSATVEDYRLVYPLLQHVLAESMSGLSEKAIAIDGAFEEMRVMWELEKKRVTWVAVTSLIDHCHTMKIADSRTVRKWAHYFAEHGFWEEQRVKGNRLEYRSVRSVSEEPVDLPTPDEIEQWMHGESENVHTNASELSEQNRADRFSGDEE